MANAWRLLFTSLLAVGTILAHSSVSAPAPITPQEQSAIVSENVLALLNSLNTVASVASSTTIELKPNLLPHLRYRPFKIASANSTSTPVALVAPTTTKPKPTVTTAVMPAAPMNAQSFLNATTISFKEQREGPFEAALTTNTGGGNSATWTLAQTSTAQFAISYTCNPIPTQALVTDPDQNPEFDIRTAYDCTVNLTPTTGNDLSMQSKDFTFTTPPGQFIIAPPSSMDTVLRAGENDGGLVFNNEDTQGVTISSITIDVSYTALNVQTGPLVLRFIDPMSGNSLGDYHMETLPLDPSSPYTHAETNIQIPLSFNIPAQKQKLLPIELLGANTMQIQGVNPTFTLTLRGVTTAQTVQKLIINGAQIQWSCVVPLGGYDPNATSGAYAEDNAC